MIRRLPLALLFWLLAWPAAAQISHVQTVGDFVVPGAAGTTFTTNAFTAVGTGNTVVGMLNTVAAVSTITDNAVPSNTYNVSSSATYDSYGVILNIFSLTNVKGNPTKLTFTYSASQTAGPTVFFDEYSGVGSINTSNIAFLSTTSATFTQAITPTVGGVTLWGGLNVDESSTVNANGAGFTQRLGDGTTGFFSEDKANVAAGATTTAWSLDFGTPAQGVVFANAALAPPSACGNLLLLGAGC